MSPPLLSIGLPVYNGEALLPDALEALLGQSFEDFELIICDNCSSDATQQICQQFASGDPRIVYRRNDRNIGAAENFNLTLQLARGELFAWANHDDSWDPAYLEKCVSLLARRPAAVLAYARASRIVIESNEEIPLLDELGLDQATPFRRLRRMHGLRIRETGVWVTGLWIPVYGVIRKSVLEKTGKIGSYIGSDTILLEELLMHGEFAEVPERLFFKRDHAGRSMRAQRAFDDRIEWFTGRPAPRLLFPHWRRLVERFRAVRRVELGLASRMACCLQFLAFSVARPKAMKSLAIDLWINLRRALAGRRGKAKLPATWK